MWITTFKKREATKKYRYNVCTGEKFRISFQSTTAAECFKVSNVYLNYFVFSSLRICIFVHIYKSNIFLTLPSSTELTGVLMKPSNCMLHLNMLVSKYKETKLLNSNFFWLM